MHQNNVNFSITIWTCAWRFLASLSQDGYVLNSLIVLVVDDSKCLSYHCFADRYAAVWHMGRVGFGSFIDTAHTVCHAGSTKLSGIHMSVCLTTRPLHATVVCLLLSTLPAGDIDQRWSSPGAQQQWCRSMVHSSKCKQCHVDSWCRKLNADLLIHYLALLYLRSLL